MVTQQDVAVQPLHESPMDRPEPYWRIKVESDWLPTDHLPELGPGEHWYPEAPKLGNKLARTNLYIVYTGDLSVAIKRACEAHANAFGGPGWDKPHATWRRRSEPAPELRLVRLGVLLQRALDAGNTEDEQRWREYIRYAVGEADPCGERDGYLLSIVERGRNIVKRFAAA